MILNKPDSNTYTPSLWATVRYQLIAKISLVLGIITVIYIPIFIAMNQYFLSLLLVPFIASYAIAYRVNKMTDHLLSAGILISTVNIGLLLYAHILGPESGIQYIFFSLIVVSSLLLDPDQRVLTAAALVLPIISYILIELNYKLPIRIDLSSISISIIKTSMILATFLIIVMAIRIYYRQIKMAQKTIQDGRLKLEATVKQLKQAHSELKEFSHIVSHDIKNPLHSIDTLSKWLIDANKIPWTDELDKELLLINKNSIRGKQLVDGILTYSEMSINSPQKKKLDSDACILETWNILNINTDIQLTIDTPMPQIIYNETQFCQIWLNLLGNSVKYMDKVDGKIHVGCTSSKTSHTFYVLDNGPGVNKNETDNIFKLFYSIGQHKGTGCGLAIVKKIIELNGGKIDIESSSNKGFHLSFSIPKSLKT